MHFGFALELSDIDLWNTDLLDTHLDLLSRDKYTDIPSKYFVCLHKIFKRSSRHVFKTSSRRLQDMSSRRLQDMSSRHLQDMSSRRLQDMSSRRLQDVFSVTIFRLPKRLQDVLQHVFKTSSRRLGRRKIVTLKTCWRRLQDVFKTNRCLLGYIGQKFTDYWILNH